jgi:hypothetical protein
LEVEWLGFKVVGERFLVNGKGFRIYGLRVRV